MANHKSAIKKDIRDEKRRAVNRVDRSKMKNRIKAFLRRLDKGQMEEAKALFPRMISRIDATIRNGTIHKKTGARYKSRLTLRARKAGLQV